MDTVYVPDIGRMKKLGRCLRIWIQGSRPSFHLDFMFTRFVNDFMMTKSVDDDIQQDPFCPILWPQFLDKMFWHLYKFAFRMTFATVHSLQFENLGKTFTTKIFYQAYCIVDRSLLLKCEKNTVLMSKRIHFCRDFVNLSVTGMLPATDSFTSNIVSQLIRFIKSKARTKSWLCARKLNNCSF